MTLSFLENVPLREKTSFRVGGSARYFCEVFSEADLEKALAFAAEKRMPFFILGGGSNILVSDDGFPGLVIKMSIDGILAKGDRITVGAGENWDHLVKYSVESGWYGLENLSGIPGTVGAGPVQNIGAYGSEIKDVIELVRVYDVKAGVFKDFLNKECGFEYRDSIFKKQAGAYVVVAVTFALHKLGDVNISYKDLQEFFIEQPVDGASGPTPKDVREAVLAIRGKKLPDIQAIGTAGSFFKNPIIAPEKFDELKNKYPDMPSYSAPNGQVKVPLAWILDHVCGYKGTTKGNVGTYKNQALVLVNNGGATAKEIKDFATELIAEVAAKTSISVEPEVQYVG